MKGLILKDLMNLKQQCKVFILVIGLWLVLSIADNNPSFFGGLVAMFAVLVTITTLAYDEKAKWDRYALTMPVSRTDIVLSKYLLAFLCSAAGTLISFAVGLALSQNITEALSTSLAFLSLAMIFASIVLPILFKFGVEKGRMIVLAVLLLPTLFALFLPKLNLAAPSEAVIKTLVLFSPL
jgi:ABC-type transport system involved in multi-copper enzyme maturation permease subunit